MPPRAAGQGRRDAACGGPGWPARRQRPGRRAGFL